MGARHSELGVRVNLDKVTWVLSGDEHVAEYQHPSNVVSAEGDDLAAMLVAGEIDAAIGAGRVDSPDVRPLIADARQAAVEYMQQTGVFPINHTIVMKNEVMEANPWLPEELFRCFKAAKETYMQHLTSGGQLAPADQAISEMGQSAGGDPLPFGVEANRKTFETFVDFTVEQKVITQKVVRKRCSHRVLSPSSDAVCSLLPSGRLLLFPCEWPLWAHSLDCPLLFLWAGS